MGSLELPRFVDLKVSAFRMGENNSIRTNGQRINLKNIQATPAAEFQKKKRVLKQAHMSGEESVLLTDLNCRFK